MSKIVLLLIGLGLVYALTSLSLWRDLQREVKETGSPYTLIDLVAIFFPGLNIFVLLVMLEDNKQKADP
jgi:hypothetical protein